MHISFIYFDFWLVASLHDVATGCTKSSNEHAPKHAPKLAAD
jgi:hypothetical protein